MDWSHLEREPGRSLERALLDDPQDPEAWQVFADHLSRHAPRLGERIMLELHANAAAGEDREAWTRRVQAFDAAHCHEWLDPSLVLLFEQEGEAVEDLALDRRYGFLFAIALDGDKLPPAVGLDEVLAALLRSPASRFLTRLSIKLGTRGDEPRAQGEAIRALVESASARPALRELHYTDPDGLTPVDTLLAWAPQLETLHAQGHLQLGAFEHARLRELSLTTSEELPAPIPGHRPALPSLTTLRLRSRAQGDDERRLAIARSLLPGFEHAVFPTLETLHIEAPRLFDSLSIYLFQFGLTGRTRTLEVSNSEFGPIAAMGLSFSKRLKRLEQLERVVVSGGHNMHPASLHGLREMLELVLVPTPSSTTQPS